MILVQEGLFPDPGATEAENLEAAAERLASLSKEASDKRKVAEKLNSIPASPRPAARARQDKKKQRAMEVAEQAEEGYRSAERLVKDLGYGVSFDEHTGEFVVSLPLNPC